MSLARPWWLAGLALLLPLIVLHLRRPALVVREVPSLLLWDRVASTVQSPNRRFERPRRPLLLLLQALALCALVVALAGPERTSASSRPVTVFVVDGSLWMHVGTRLDDARADVQRLAAQFPTSTIAVVSATGTPSLVYRGSRGGLASAIGHLDASSGAGDLTAAVSLGSSLLGGPQGRMIVLRAPENGLPPIAADQGQLATQVIGSSSPDQGLFDAGARCGIGPSAVCEVVASLRNGSSARRIDSYTAFVDGRRSRALRVDVPPRSSSKIVLTAPPGALVQLKLSGRDPLALDDSAWISVPSTANAPSSSTVTLVGDPTGALPVAQAFAAIPGVRLELRTPASYRPKDARASDLLVLDGFVPPSGLPPSPAVALIAPPRLPGGAIGGALPNPTVSSTVAGSDLLEGVDLGSLNVDPGAARQLTLPDWMAPVVSTPGGALLAAGDDGRQRLAVLAFDPARSNLAQLAAFPILARNLVRWASAWTAPAGDGALVIDAVPGAARARVAPRSGVARSVSFAGRAAGLTDIAPGAFGVHATGTGVSHRRALTTSPAAPSTAPAAPASSAPIDLTTWRSAALRRSGRSLVPWLLVLALAAIAGDWAWWRRVRSARA